MKMFVMGKRVIAVVAIVLVAALSICTIGIYGNKAVKTATENRVIPIYRVKTDEKKVAISFDAAWGNEDTQSLIDIMAKYNVKATFFVVGEWVDKYPESVKALADAGHDIMNHSNTHPHMPQLSSEKIKEEINACNDKIENITGVRPTLLRMPFGDYDNLSQQVATECGCYTIQWDVDSLDWKKLEAPQIVERVTKRVTNGSIVLFHNAALHTPEALPTIIETLQSQGYEFVKISNLIYKENYAVDHTGEQYATTTQTETKNVEAPPEKISALDYIKENKIS